MDASLIKRPVITDFNAFIEMKSQAQTNKSATLEKAARQFEAIFMERMLKSMRTANNFLSDSSPLKSKQADTFEEMLDQQRSLEFAAKGKGIGLADMMIKQLDKRNQVFAHQGRSIKRNESITSNQTIKDVLSSVAERKNMVLSPKDFVAAIWPAAQKFAQELGVDPKLLVAQAIHETGWGKHMVKDEQGEPSLNLFNIKGGGSWQKSQTKVLTTEYIDGEAVKVREPFRQYGSIQESFYDYVSLIKNNDRYHKALSNSTDSQRYMNHLQQAGYATDPNYANKVMSIYQGSTLNDALQRLEDNE